MTTATVTAPDVAPASDRASFDGTEHTLLLDLLALPTAGPLEGVPTDRVRLWEAQRRYAEAAARLGFVTVSHSAPDPSWAHDALTPASVVRAADADPGFLACQPSLVLRLGPERGRARTVMFNVHLDTVAGDQPADFVDGRFLGRGAIDAKGPAVALLAGIRAALAADPLLTRRVTVLIQAVSGEEGGAMGVFGTRPLIAAGHYGRLNIFCEPTGRRVLTRSTAATTARVTVSGEDAIDDAPAAGHNAGVLLGHLGAHLARDLPAATAEGQVCVAGLQTGPLHNKVYGTGRLLVNCSYGRADDGTRLRTALEHVVRAGAADFRRRYADVPLLRRTAADAERIVGVEWLKTGLPVLRSDDHWAEALLTERAGLARWPSDEPAFTCDAIWADGLPGAFAAVYGPGALDTNNAHAEGEFADLAELENYAADIGRLLTVFADATADFTSDDLPADSSSDPSSDPLSDLSAAAAARTAACDHLPVDEEDS